MYRCSGLSNIGTHCYPVDMPESRACEGAADLLDVLARLDLPVTSSRREVRADGSADCVIDLDGEDQPLVVGVKHTPSPAGVRQLVDRHRLDPAHHILVANRLSTADKEILEQAGWDYLDRRGHLRLWLDRVRVDTRIDPLIEVPRRSPLDTGTGQAVAVCLPAADGPLTVRGIARETGVAVSSVSTALADLRAEALVRESSSEAVVPELFWLLAAPMGGTGT